MNKAIATGFRPNSFWLRDIWVHNDVLGKPHLEFTQRMQAILDQGITESHISSPMKEILA